MLFHSASLSNKFHEWFKVCIVTDWEFLTALPVSFMLYITRTSASCLAWVTRSPQCCQCISHLRRKVRKGHKYRRAGNIPNATGALDLLAPGPIAYSVFQQAKNVVPAYASEFSYDDHSAIRLYRQQVRCNAMRRAY